MNKEEIVKEFFSDYQNMEMKPLCEKWWKRWNEIPEPAAIASYLEKIKNFSWGKSHDEIENYAYRVVMSVRSSKRY